MEDLLLVISLAILIALCAGGMLINPPTVLNDDPAPPIRQVQQLSATNSFDFSFDNPILLVDGPAGAVGGNRRTLCA